ncbi:MAG: Helix-turn-helix domain [Gammaproteobacteria bacterium]|jgi:transcriptional regulator with XRE-family HTH domain|nr:Helix-turn-helix domain [Gammaproteobacteria bacterium]
MDTLNTVGKRLVYLLRSHNITLQQLAHQLNVSKQTISLICNDKISKPRKLDEIADILEVSYRWLAFGEDDDGGAKNFDGLILNRYRKIPFISNADLNKEMILDKKLTIPLKSNNFELTSDPEYKHLFALKATNNALQIKFGQANLIFHTNLEPVSGDFVICYLPDKDLFVYRDLEIRGNKKILIPLDKHIYNTLTLRKTDIIVAVLYQIHQQRNEHGGFNKKTH